MPVTLQATFRMRIASFAHKGLRRLYHQNSERGLPARSAHKLRNMLAFLDAMSDTRELPSPALKWQAHRLSGNRDGTWALSVTGN
jgi:proteic killer suppression protein